MLNIDHRINAFVRLGVELQSHLSDWENNSSSLLSGIIKEAHESNPWFTIPDQLMALNAIAAMLTPSSLEKWISSYDVMTHPKKIGVVMAGNIPAVGFHDFLCTLISGHRLIARCSSNDSVLMRFISDELVRIEPRMAASIRFADKLNDADAYIATGSDNTARYFEYYFRKHPHIIRNNRSGIAILTGNETDKELALLGKDIFSYFGLGCRNVSKLYVPPQYDFNRFFSSMQGFASVMNHHKYMSNYDYHRAVLLLNKEKFLTNNFLIVKESRLISSPVSVLHYEWYSDETAALKIPDIESEKIQCIVSHSEKIKNRIDFGNAQSPRLNDYADGVDTMKFLTSAFASAN